MDCFNTNTFYSNNFYQEKLLRRDAEFIRWQRDLMEAEKEYEWERNQLEK